MKIVAAMLLALTLTLTGCGSDGDAADGADAPPSAGTTSDATKAVVVEVVIAGGQVTPLAKKVEAKVGEPITLHVTSDADEEIHVHSDPEHEYEVAAGDNESFSFTIDTPGQVAVEAHHLDVTIVELVVRP